MATWTVGASGDYLTIQAAIDAGTTMDGDTIVVDPGTYNENLSITKGVTIQGANAGVAGDGVRGAETIITGTSTISAASQVVIDGVEFLDSTPYTDPTRTSLSVNSFVSHEITNSVFLRDPSVSNPADTFVGINGVTEHRAVYVGIHAAGSVTISDNLFTSTNTYVYDGDVWKRGIWSDGGGGGLTIEDNVFEHVRSAINSDQTSAATSITGNTFQDLGTAFALGLTFPNPLDSYLNTNTFDNVDTEYNFRNLTTPVEFDADNNTYSGVGIAGQVLIEGGSSNDTFLGSDTAEDVILGNNGLDTISGRGGNDTLLGGAGNDLLDGGADNDLLLGEAGADSLVGGLGTDTASYATSLGVSVDLSTGIHTGDAAGDTFTDVEIIVGSSFADTLTGNDATNDSFFGGAGNDTLSGGDGNDRLWGDAGADTLNGGLGDDHAMYDNSALGVTVDLNLAVQSDPGTDADGDVLTSIESVHGSLTGANTLTGTDAGDEHLKGGNAADTLVGMDGADTLDGLAGDDLLDDGAGNDTINAGDGNDSILGGGGADAIDGGDDIDTLDYSGSAAGVTVNLGTGTGTGGDAAGDTIANVENVIGSAFADTLTGDGGDNTLQGGAGNDTLDGGAGSDTADFSDATGPVAVNTFSGIATGAGIGTDKLIGIENFINVSSLIGGSGDDTVEGGTGNDSLNGGGGNDTIDGGDGADKLNGGSGNDSLEGSTGNDTLVGATGNDAIDGGDDNDRIFGDQGNDTILGGAGNDLLYGGAGNDTLGGGADNDTMFGGAGSDVFDFNVGDGHDRIMDFGKTDFLDIGDFGFADFAAFQGSVTLSKFANVGFTIDFGGGDILDVTGKTLTQFVNNAGSDIIF